MITKVFYIISDIKKALAFEWILDSMDKDEIHLRFVIIGEEESELISFLKNRKATYYVLPFSGKKDLLRVWIKIFLILRKEKPDIVHAHLYVANILGLSAAWLLRISKRIYTRHHAMIHHEKHRMGVTVDKLINLFSTDIVVLSRNHMRILQEMERVPAKKLHLIPHGFDLQYFNMVDQGKIDALRLKYNLNDNAYPVVGVISRYTAWKGVQFIIPAFKELIEQFPRAHLILANAQGDYSKDIKLLLKSLPSKVYTEITFESDIASLYHLFDVFVHVPVNEFCESFGQTYVEALAAGIPSVFTLSGIASDFIEHEKNALVVNFMDSNAIFQSIKRILTDHPLRQMLINQGKCSITQFSLPSMIHKLENLYTKLL